MELLHLLLGCEVVQGERPRWQRVELRALSLDVCLLLGFSGVTLTKNEKRLSGWYFPSRVVL